MTTAKMDTSLSQCVCIHHKNSTQKTVGVMDWNKNRQWLQHNKQNKVLIYSRILHHHVNISTFSETFSKPTSHSFTETVNSSMLALECVSIRMPTSKPSHPLDLCLVRGSTTKESSRMFWCSYHLNSVRNNDGRLCSATFPNVLSNCCKQKKIKV